VQFHVRLHREVVKNDLARLPANIQSRILDAIETRLAAAPDRLGKPLTSGLGGYRRLRVGDYRVIYKVTGNNVIVLTVGHRKEVYETAVKGREAR